MDDFDAAAAAVPAAAASQPTSLLSAFDQANSAAPAPAPAPVPASTGWSRFKTGLFDLPVKVAQIESHILPAPVLSGIDAINSKIAQLRGGQYVPMGELDQAIDQRESNYQAARAAAGSAGMDWYRLAGNVSNPVNFIGPAAGATTLARAGLGAAQGAVSSVLSTPTTGDDQKNFWQSQARLGVFGALGGSGATLGAEALAPGVSKGMTYLRNLVSGPASSAADAQAEQLAAQAFKAKGIDPSTVAPEMYSWFKQQVQSALQSGAKPDPVTAGNLAEAASLPVPVPLLKGQASRDPMKYAMEQNLRGVQGVGEPITEVLGQQNKALIANLDAMGARNAPNIVDAGQRAISTLQALDQQAQGAVRNAYSAFKSATGRDLDVPLQGVAQDYARVLHEYGDAVPSGIRNQFQSLGLLDGTQNRVFSIDDAENLLKSINRQYDPGQKASASALDELRRSVQGAIQNGAGASADGAEAAQLAQQARAMAAQRFKLIDTVPAYKAAVTGNVAPDKFLQKFFWNGNAGDIANLKTLLGADPEALNTLKASIMGDLKQTALNNQSPENGVFSQAKYNGLIRDQNNVKRFGALFEPQEVQRLNSLGNVAEVAMVAPKAAAVNTSNTASAAANLVQGVAQGGVGTKALSLLGKADIPIASPLARFGANKAGAASLSSLVKQSTQPLSAADLDALNFLTKRTGALAGAATGQSQK